MSRQLFDRRTLLRLTGSIGFIGTAERIVAIPAEAQSRSGVSIAHSESARFRSIGIGESSSLLIVEVNGARLGGDDGHWFRISNERGNQVRIEPQHDDATVVNENIVFDLYRENGEIVDDPFLNVSGQEIPVSISGETEMFASEPIFEAYRVDLMNGAENIASTDDRIYGINYPSEMSQDGRTGEIEVTFPRVDEVSETWAVFLEINTYDADGVGLQELRSEFEHQDTEFITRFDTTSLVPVPEDGHRGYNVSFYVDGNPENGPPNLWAWGRLFIEDSGTEQTTVDAEVTSFETPNLTVEPGDSVTSEVSVRNTGTYEHQFFVGYDVVAPDNRHFNGEGSTGETITLGPDEQGSVEVTWIASSGAPAGSYDTLTVVWEESDSNELETPLGRAENTRAFELESSAFPAGTDILPPVTPEQFPYSHIQELDFPGLGLDGEGITGDGVQVTVDSDWIGENQFELRVGVKNPQESLLKELYGYGSSQVLVLYDDSLAVENGNLRSSVDGGEPQAIDIGSTIVSLVSLGSASSVVALVKEAVQSAAEEVGEGWVTSQLTFDTPPDFEEQENGLSAIDIDFSTETMPGATSPSTIEEYELRATFSVSQELQESTLTVVTDMRGFTRQLPNPNPITRAFGSPVEYRRQVNVPIDRAAKEVESTTTNGSGTAGNDEGDSNQSGTPGFGMIGTLASLSGVSYLLKRHKERKS